MGEIHEAHEILSSPVHMKHPAENWSQICVNPFSVFRPAGKSLSDTALKRQQNQVNGTEEEKVANVRKH